METPIASFFVCENYEVLIISNLYGFEIAKTFMKNKLTWIVLLNIETMQLIM